MAPKKQEKKTMGVAEFLKNESYGSWADEMDDIPIGTTTGPSLAYSSRRDYSTSDSGYGNSLRGGERDSFRSDRGGREDRHAPRQSLPIPDKPPYTAHIGNLSWDTTESQIEAHFASCNVTNVRIVRDKMEDRPKGFGYVEFESREGLVKALDMSGSQLGGRNVRVSVADPPKEREESRTAGQWRREGPLTPIAEPRRNDRFHGDRNDGGDRPERRFEPASDGKVRDLDKWERKGPLAPLSPSPASESGPREFTRRHSDRPAGDRPTSSREVPEGGPRREFRPPVERQLTAAEKDNEWRKNARPDPTPKEHTAPTSPVAPATRPKLELKKRSEPILDGPAVAEPASATSTKPNPFGAAKPIDAEARIREVEERRAALKREQEERQRREAEERKAKEEAEKQAAAEKAAAEIAEAEKPPLKVETDRIEQPARSERNITSPREGRDFSHRGGYRSDRGDRNGRGGRDRTDKGDRGDRRLPLGEREWRRGPGPAGQDRRTSRDDTKAEAAPKAEPVVEPAEEGWSTVSARKGRGGFKVATS